MMLSCLRRPSHASGRRLMEAGEGRERRWLSRVSVVRLGSCYLWLAPLHLPHSFPHYARRALRSVSLE